MSTLDDFSARLPREVPTKRDLWPVLERRLLRRRRARRVALWSASAAGLLLAAALPVALVRASPLERARADYRDARQALLRALEAEAGELDPAAVTIVKRDLEQLDRDLAAIALEPDQRGAAVTAIAARYERDTRLIRETAKLVTLPAAPEGVEEP